MENGRAFQFGEHRIDLAGYDGGAVLERPKAILGCAPNMSPSAKMSARAYSAAGGRGTRRADRCRQFGLAAGRRAADVGRIPVEQAWRMARRSISISTLSKASLFDAGTECGSDRSTDLSGAGRSVTETGAHGVPFDPPGDSITALHAAGVIRTPTGQ